MCVLDLEEAIGVDGEEEGEGEVVVGEREGRGKWGREGREGRIIFTEFAALESVGPTSSAWQGSDYNPLSQQKHIHP